MFTKIDYFKKQLEQTTNLLNKETEKIFTGINKNTKSLK